MIHDMNVGAISPVSGGGAAYAPSPYLNGVTRTSDAAFAAQTGAIARVTPAPTPQPAVTLTPTATGTALPAAPFDNPAITQIAARVAVSFTPAGTAIAPTSASVAADNLAGASLQGDSGLLIQSYGAVALIEAPLALAPLYVQPTPRVIPPVAPVRAVARVAAVAT